MALPVASWFRWTAIRQGTPPPLTYFAADRVAGPFGSDHDDVHAGRGTIWSK
jgi:hypothetical protein